jgi:hypothetical protein
MNERIRELAEQAHVTVLTTKGMENISDGCYIVSPNKLQEFAKALIKECARVIDRGDGAMSSMAETSWCNICRDDILKHFGVEE